MRKKKIILFIFEIVFYLVIPVLIVVSQYYKIYDTYFKLGLTGIMLLIIIFVLFKKIFIDKYIEELKGQIINFKSDFKTETDFNKLANIKRELVKAKTINVIFGSISPILFLGVFLFLSKALEAQIVKLSGVLGFVLVSFVLGVIVSVLNARTVIHK